DQDAVLADQPNKRDEANLAVDVQRAAGECERKQCACYRQRDCQQNDQRVHETLELRGKNEKDEPERQHENEEQAASRLLELTRFAGKIIANAWRQHAVGGRLEKI